MSEESDVMLPVMDSQKKSTTKEPEGPRELVYGTRALGVVSRFRGKNSVNKNIEMCSYV